jgi:hypothetical protein
MDEPIISIRQPWASAIFHADKDVENRSWFTDYRGRLWIHAARTLDHDHDPRLRFLLDDLPLGVILGSVELVDVVTDSRSSWAQRDAFHWLLADPRTLATPIARRGRPGLTWFTPPTR